MSVQKVWPSQENRLIRWHSESERLSQWVDRTICKLDDWRWEPTAQEALWSLHGRHLQIAFLFLWLENEIQWRQEVARHTCKEPLLRPPIGSENGGDQLSRGYSEGGGRITLCEAEGATEQSSRARLEEEPVRSQGPRREECEGPGWGLLLGKSWFD